jgi:ubiquinone/menaquinone biosynthesis C-methylase UbiE
MQRSSSRFPLKSVSVCHLGFTSMPCSRAQPFCSISLTLPNLTSTHLRTGNARRCLTSTSSSPVNTTGVEVDHDAVVRREFAEQAARGFDSQSASTEEMLVWARQALDLRSNHRVLDVAAGTGRISRTVAPYVREVVALDITQEMMDVGKKEAQQAAIHNIDWVLSRAQQMPFEDNSFDLVVSRLAVHHWKEPQVILNEMSRVCKSGGHVAIIDIVVPPHFAHKQDQINHWERLRDPSHVAFLTIPQLQHLFESARPRLRLCTAETHPKVGQLGYGAGIVDMRDNFNLFQRWFNLTNTPETVRKEIVQAMEAELNEQANTNTTTTGKMVSGMQPSRDDQGRLRFVHKYVVALAERL